MELICPLLSVVRLMRLQMYEYLRIGYSSSPTGPSTATSSSPALWTVKVTACPGYDWSSQSTPDEAVWLNMTYKFPVTPVIASSPWYMARTYPNGTTNAGTGATRSYLGVAVNGVALYNDANANIQDAYVYEKQTFDTCYGHNSPNPKGLYVRLDILTLQNLLI